MKPDNPPLWDSTLQTISSIPPSAYCQAFFIFLSSGVLAVAITPPSARRHLLNYGARSGSSSSAQNVVSEVGLSRIVATLTSWGQVPHSWFMAFYTTSLACSMCWLGQYLGHGWVLKYLVTQQATKSNSASSMLPGQVVVLWGMMVLQASRRVYEHMTLMKPSKSKMWCVHWLLGLSFYLCMSMSLWIEGADAILGRKVTIPSVTNLPLKTLGGSLVFLFAWVNQYRCHKYLAGLKKYSLPKEIMFRYLVSPHYTCECLLYLAMAVAGAPQGACYNKTLVCGLLFIVTNLGVTAAGTRKWYVEKFGAGAVQRKWNMIPFLY